MAEAIQIKPDLNFIKEVKELGGESLKKCFQCATCSVVCKLSPEERPFPRKEMIWAQWGLKDRLLNDLDVWLCYNCNDCSVHCPRGAKPGEVLSAVRNYSFKEYAFPKFMGKALSQAKYLPLLFGFPILLLILILMTHDIPSGPILFREFLPYHYVDAAAAIFTVLILISIISGVKKFWANLNEGSASASNQAYVPFMDAVKSNLVKVVVQILRHDKFSDCEANKIRYYAHLAIFYGFISCFLATAIVAGCIWAVKLLHLSESLLPPWPTVSIVKLFGNAGGLAILVGSILILYNRYGNQDRAGTSTYYDSVFSWVVLFVALSGLLTQFARMAEIAFLAYFLYGIHLILVFFLFAYLPYSKFAHMIYRVVAMLYAESIGRSGREID